MGRREEREAFIAPWKQRRRNPMGVGIENKYSTTHEEEGKRGEGRIQKPPYDQLMGWSGSGRAQSIIVVVMMFTTVTTITTISLHQKTEMKEG